jgi:hypothetical protein
VPSLKQIEREQLAVSEVRYCQCRFNIDKADDVSRCLTCNEKARKRYDRSRLLPECDTPVVSEITDNVIWNKPTIRFLPSLHMHARNYRCAVRCRLLDPHLIQFAPSAYPSSASS